MTERLLVPTDFEDISELAQGLADRVDDGRLMLYGPEPFPDGVPVRFSVLLHDRTAALEGTGRSVVSIDGGADRDPGVRYDIVLEHLELEGSAEVVYERILMARHSAVTAMAVDPSASNGDGHSEWQEVHPDEDADSSFAAKSQALSSGVLSRSSHGPAWRPSAAPAGVARPSTGLFQHGAALPLPRHAPRPDIDPSARVARAQRPGEAGEATRTDVEVSNVTEDNTYDAETHALELPAESYEGGMRLEGAPDTGERAVEEPHESGRSKKKKRRR